MLINSILQTTTASTRSALAVRRRRRQPDLWLTPLLCAQPVDGTMGHQDYITGQYYTGTSSSACPSCLATADSSLDTVSQSTRWVRPLSLPLPSR